MDAMNASINAKIAASNVFKASAIDVNLVGNWTTEHLCVNLYVEMDIELKLKNAKMGYILYMIFAFSAIFYVLLDA